MKRAFVATWLAVALAGCSGLNLAPTQAEQFLVLDVPRPATPVSPVSPARAPRREGSLLLAPTLATAFYDSTDIAFSKSAGTRGRYQFSHWTEPPGQRIGALLATRLQASGMFRSIAASNSGVRGRWLLRTQVDEIYHDASGSPGTARLTVSAELSDPGRRELLGRRSFSAVVPAASFDAEGAARGLSTALAQVLDELTAWVEATAVE